MKENNKRKRFARPGAHLDSQNIIGYVHGYVFAVDSRKLDMNLVSFVGFAQICPGVPPCDRL